MAASAAPQVSRSEPQASEAHRAGARSEAEPSEVQKVAS